MTVLSHGFRTDGWEDTSRSVPEYIYAARLVVLALGGTTCRSMATHLRRC